MKKFILNILALFGLTTISEMVFRLRRINKWQNDKILMLLDLHAKRQEALALAQAKIDRAVDIGSAYCEDPLGIEGGYPSDHQERMAKMGRVGMERIFLICKILDCEGMSPMEDKDWINKLLDRDANGYTFKYWEK